jgi:hypothetical protein
MKNLHWCYVIMIFTSCSSITNIPDSQLKSGYYHYSEKGTPYEKVYVIAKEDSIKILKSNGQTITADHAKQRFQRRSFDVDVLTVPFKFRPTSYNFPRQLTTSFNGSVYLGYRIDRFKMRFLKTPIGDERHIMQQGITVGAFGGIGSASISPWSTNNRISDEYTGFIFNRGFAAMVGVNNLTVGIGIGWDYLTDRDKYIWIYQNKHWIGLTLSLHIN